MGDAGDGAQVGGTSASGGAGRDGKGGVGGDAGESAPGAGDGGAPATTGAAGGGGEAATAACVPEMEWCDQRDNDCNGVADDRFACHDDSVANTRPFARGVYLVGRAANTGCGSAKGVQQFWPTRVTDYLGGFECLPSWFQFRRSDDALFYITSSKGLLRHGSPPTAVPTLPCGGQVRSGYGFDAQNRLYYQCGSSLLRGAGELLADPIQAIVGVFDDGRVLVTRATSTNASAYVTLDANGLELSRLAPQDLFTGKTQLLPNAASFDGTTAYLAFSRVYDQATNEIVVYTVDAGSQFRLVRRRIVPEFGLAQAVVSDGTIFVLNQQGVRAYLPDNTERVAWNASEGIFVYFGTGDPQLIVGPRVTQEAP